MTRIRHFFTEAEVEDLGDWLDEIRGRKAAASKRVLKVSEAARELRISEKTIRARIKAELIPTVPNMGRNVRIPADFIQATTASGMTPNGKADGQ